MSAAISDPLIGSIIADRYEVIRRIAKGGMGTIYEVRNTRLGRTFALKTITAEAAQDPEVLARFRREADVVANLSHPHIVEVVDWDQLDDGAPFLVMEYLRGESLAGRIHGVGPLPWAQIALFSDQVLSALGVAHRAGVVHRDLKPDNIFLAVDDAGEERVKLLDFGISKIRDSQTFQTTDAKVLGTPAYMAPEQAEGRHDKIGPMTDIWAMGTIIYEMVTGSVAFAAPSAPAILYRVCHGRPTPANELRADTPTALVELLDWALDKELRLEDVEELREELRKVLTPLEGVTWAAPMRSRMMDSVRRVTPIGIRMSTPMPVARPSIRASTPFPRARSEVVRAATEPPVVTPGGETLVDAPTPMVGEMTATTLSPAAPRAKLPLILGGAGAFVLSGVLVFVLTRKGDDTPAIDPAIPAPAVETKPPDKVAPPPTAQVELSIESTPSGADIYRLPSEAKVGVTPWSEKVDKGSGEAVFIVKAYGYRDQKVEIDLATGGTQTVTLKPNVTTIRRNPVPPPPPKDKRRKGEPVNPFQPKIK